MISLKILLWRASKNCQFQFEVLEEESPGTTRQEWVSVKADGRYGETQKIQD